VQVEIHSFFSARAEESPARFAPRLMKDGADFCARARAALFEL
jgi:hypothetical protein